MSEKYWFKRRRYGYGWTPVTWQGWTVVISWLLFIIVMSIVVLDDAEETPEVIWSYLALVALSIVPLILLSYLKGPSPKWRWGKKEDDDPKLDI